jgi:nucleoside-diphosphate-sugar epimerase
MILEGKVVCVTGAAGFIGKALCGKLVERGEQVIAVDNFLVGARNSLAQLEDKVDVVDADIRELETLREPLSRSHVTYHLAALANPRTCAQDFALAFDINVRGTANVLNLCGHCDRVIFLSSVMVHGEPRYLPIDEQHPLDGHDPYSISKIICEYLMKLATHMNKIPITIIRNSNGYGPGQSLDYLIPTLISQALHQKVIEVWDPKVIRDFLYIDDVVEALIRSAEAEAAAGETLNLGSGHGIATGELAEIVSKLLGVEWVDVKKPSPVSSKMIADISKIKALTGWQPLVPLEEGLQRTIDYYQKSTAQSGS